FEREARTVSALQHPAICQLFDVGREGDVDYLVMEYVEGETLADRLRRGALPLPEALRVAAAIADALGRAHASGVVHRDLKPGNVMLGPSGPKLLDFGLAKPAGDPIAGDEATVAQDPADPTTPQTPLTRRGTILGTLAYMSPEQLQGHAADARSDLFALGATLYEMVAGKRAFAGESQASVIAAILEREPEPLSSARPEAPPLLSRVLARCLAKDPRQRWESARDLAEQLRWIEAGLDSGATAIVTTPATPAPRSRARHLAWLVLLLPLVAPILFNAFRSDPPAPAPPLRFTVAPDPSARALDVPKISPDGTKIAYGLHDGTTWSIWVRPLDSLESRRLEGTEGSSLPFWSPDSRHLAFFQRERLRRISIDGGPPQTICDAPNGDAGTWSADGTILFDGDERTPLKRVDARGGTPAPALGADSSSWLGWPTMLPDQRHFLALRIPADLDYRLVAGDVTSHEIEPMGPAPSQVLFSRTGHALYVADGSLTARPFDAARRRFSGDPVALPVQLEVNRWGEIPLSIADDGTVVYRRSLPNRMSVVALNRAGHVTEQISDEPVRRLAVPSPDGGRIATEVRPSPISTDRDLWILDRDRHTRVPIVTDPEDDYSPVWSPDGSRLAYVSRAGERFEIRTVSASGGAKEVVIRLESVYLELSQWSPDGRWILTDVSPPEGDTYVARVDVETGELVPVVPQVQDERSFFGVISSDGNWLLYVARTFPQGGGVWHAYVAPFPAGGPRTQISVQETWAAHWTAANEVVYLGSDRNAYAVSISGMKSGKVVPAAPRALFIAPGSTNLDIEFYPDPRGDFLWTVQSPDDLRDAFVVLRPWTQLLPGS
ncbi:MAG: serine/threonine-protein kinase, partial [Gemmatimonadetes bacterium]|nr:serine/threonine-protein kinase [Gemmatimonadota bacterium]